MLHIRRPRGGSDNVCDRRIPEYESASFVIKEDVGSAACSSYAAYSYLPDAWRCFEDVELGNAVFAYGGPVTFRVDEIALAREYAGFAAA